MTARRSTTAQGDDPRKARFKEGLAQQEAAKETRVSDALDSLHVVSLNGKPYTFGKYTFRDLALIEEHYGSMPEFFEGIEEGKTTAYLLATWLQLRKTVVDLELDDVFAFVIAEQGNLLDLTRKAVEASGLFNTSEPEGSDPNADGADEVQEEAEALPTIVD